MKCIRLLLLLLLVPSASAADAPGVMIDQARLARLNAATMPKLEEPTLFNAEAADAVLSALEIFPPDNPWNIPVDTWPIAKNSDAMIVAIGADKPLRGNDDMSFVLVPTNQTTVNVKLSEYSTESDVGPFLSTLFALRSRIRGVRMFIRRLILPAIRRTKTCLGWANVFVCEGVLTHRSFLLTCGPCLTD